MRSACEHGLAAHEAIQSEQPERGRLCARRACVRLASDWRLQKRERKKKMNQIRNMIPIKLYFIKWFSFKINFIDMPWMCCRYRPCCHCSYATRLLAPHASNGDVPVAFFPASKASVSIKPMCHVFFGTAISEEENESLECVWLIPRLIKNGLTLKRKCKREWEYVYLWRQLLV